MTQPVNAVEMNNISKSFFGTKVLNDVSFVVRAGEIHALAGENGAGKSTLMKILQGVYQKDAGEIRVAGESKKIESFADALASGIGMVFQEFSLVPDLTVAQNIFLNREPKNKFGMITDNASVKQAREILANLDLDLDVAAKVRTLGRAYQQLTEIAKAISFNAKVLILDEPTAGVDIEIRRSMWKMMEEVNQQGTTIILTTHYLEEAESLCRNIAIIDQGRIVENTDMASLLARLHVDHFVLDLAEPLAQAPVIAGYQIERIADKVLDVAVPKEIGLNYLFNQLSEKNIKVVSLKNKSNRLEQLFMSLIDTKSAGNK